MLIIGFKLKDLPTSKTFLKKQCFSYLGGIVPPILGFVISFKLAIKPPTPKFECGAKQTLEMISLKQSIYCLICTLLFIDLKKKDFEIYKKSNFRLILFTRLLHLPVKKRNSNFSNRTFTKINVYEAQHLNSCSDLGLEEVNIIKQVVHPVVYLTIVDAFERRSNKPGANDKALGTLMGFYEKNAIQVTNCYAIPFREQKEDTPELDDGFNQTMLMMMKRATPSEQPVG
ncbi:unnamed protein product [Brugia timori]|uniref:MPN domain-containing protein n=1 Tax=Brugia timori TaxID=42155 RepID=A0A0R3Q360_9BILA|nr:unnamed protein product [Brugia timori]